MAPLPTDVFLPDRLLHESIEKLQDIATLFYRRNLSLGTSSNYSILLRREPFALLVTASGKDKRRLKSSDFVIVDEAGKVVGGESGERASAETALHTMLAQRPNVGAVLHTHSVWGTLLSDLHAESGGFIIEGYEMLKGLAGVATHEHREWVEIFANSQDIPALARQAERRLDDPERPPLHGFLLRNHGLYTWGRDVDEARRHIEIFEFLFETLVRRRSL
ncbi:MAG: methylthioribulose 1-phosphate dehydratase [Planctomycetota bacterium]